MSEKAPSGAGKTVCVTGASGFIGSHVVKQFLERGYTVRGTVRNASDEGKYGWVKQLADGTPGKVELYSADLLDEGSFDKAMEGCEFVCHTAAAVTLNAKDPKKDVVDPALDGTRNVFDSILKAKAAKRVVLTSSVAALLDENGPNGRTYTENDWHQELSLKSAYAMGKTLAEKHAWKEYEEQKAKAKEEGASGWSFELVAINPACVLGDFWHKSSIRTSAQTVIQLLDGSLPMAPDFYWSIVHVRDVALAHVLGIENEKAQGRYIIAADELKSMLDMAKVIKSKYPLAKTPTAVLPTLLLYAVALFNPALNIEIVRRMAGRKHYFSSKKVTEELGIELISSEKAILDTVESVYAHGIVPRPESAAPKAKSSKPARAETTPSKSYPSSISFSKKKKPAEVPTAADGNPGSVAGNGSSS